MPKTLKILFLLALVVPVASIAPRLQSLAWAQSDTYSDSEIRAVETSDEAKIRQLRDEEITQLRIALGRRSPNNRRADLYFRLAEIYLEAYHSTFLLEGRTHEKRLEKGMNDKLIDRSHSKPFLNGGISACQSIVSLGIPYTKMDRVIYFLAFNYGELGEPKQAIKYHEMLVRQYPDSPFLPEAFKELGDDAYGEGQYAKAIYYFTQALKKATPDTSPRIDHKLAWSYYRLKQYDKAIESMKLAISGANQSGEKFVSLREEALRDMAVFMTEGGRVEEAIQYFQQVAGDKDYYSKILEKLGHQYERNVEPAKAALVYESLLKTNPESEPAFRVKVKLVDLDLRQAHYETALKRVAGLTIPKAGDKETDVSAQNLRAMIRRTATEHHEAFRRKGGHESLEIAEAFYSAYLREFLAKDDPRGETPEIQMYLAEVERDLGKSNEASALYRKVVESKDKRYAKEAGALWTASLSEAIKKANQGQPKAAGMRDGEPSPLEKEFVEAADSLQEALGETPEGREASLRAAQVLAGYRSTQKDAIVRIRKIVERWPRSAQALTAARLWVQMLADDLPAAGTAPANGAQSDAMTAMSETSKGLRANPDLMSNDQAAGGGKLRAMLAEEDQHLLVNSIAKQEGDKDYAGAAKGYENIAGQSPQREVAEKAYNNSVSSYLKAGDSAGVERVSVAWVKRYPRSAKASETLRLIATRLLIEGMFDGAASQFERIGEEASDPDALETAARIREGNGDGGQARADWTRYLASYPKAPGRQAAALALAHSADLAGDGEVASKAYRTCMAGTGSELSAQCAARLADMLFRDKMPDEARAVLKKLAAVQLKKGDGEDAFVSYARYRLADLMEKSASFEALRLPEAQLQKAIKQRLDFLEPLARAYSSAVDAGGPWAVASLGRLASFAFRFADDVDQISPPQGVDENGLIQFRKGLTKFTVPLREQAIKSWRDAYSKAVAAELLSPAVPEIADRLADARAASPVRAQGARGKLRLAGGPSDGGMDGLAPALRKARDRLVKNAQDSSGWVDYGNLLYGSSKPLLAKLAYDRALSLNRKNPDALNNRGVIVMLISSNWGPAGTLPMPSSQGAGGTSPASTSSFAASPNAQTQALPLGLPLSLIDDWIGTLEAMHAFQDALRQDSFHVPAKANRGMLLGYYRIFAKAKPVWEQLLEKEETPDVIDGLAVAEQGLGELDEAQASFQKATDQGGAKNRFAKAYNEAARLGLQASQDQVSGAGACLERLDSIDPGSINGFERDAVSRLKGSCTRWKLGK